MHDLFFSSSSGSYKDLEGLRHHDDFDVSLLVCHNAAPFEEQSEGERHLLRYREMKGGIIYRTMEGGNHFGKGYHFIQ